MLASAIKRQRDSLNFTFLEVCDKELLERVFEFRYKVITETEIFKEYVGDNNFINNKESDIYDPYSVHFVVLDDIEDVCATVRLIYNCPHGYPTENCMVFDNSIFERDKLGEMSRIFVGAKYRNIKTTMSIMNGLKKLMYHKMMKLSIEYTYGALEPRFIRLLKMYKIQYEVLAPKQLHGKMGLRHPSVLYTSQLGKDNPEFIQAWKENYAE